MTSLVFFGAGASKPFGIPTMQEMVIEFEEKLKNNHAELFDFYSIIKDVLIKEYGYSEIDIESMLSVINGISENRKPAELGHFVFYYMSNNCSHNGFSLDEIKLANKLQEQLHNYIKDACKIKITNEQANMVYRRSYFPLFKLMKVNKVNYEGNPLVDKVNYTGKILVNKVNYEGDILVDNWKAYTTNYDNIFEDFWNVFRPPFDHFEKIGDSNIDYFNIKELPTKHTFSKLHGSLDWTKEVETGRIMRKKQAGFNRFPTEGEVMLFPIQQKDLYLHPWFTLFQDLKLGLSKKEIWYVIGYAFNDEFIKNVFQESLVRDPSKKLVIINPEAEKIKDKFPESIHKQIDILPINFGSKFFELQFEDYTENIKTIVLRFDTMNNPLVEKIHQLIVKSNRNIQSAKILNDDISIKNSNVNNARSINGKNKKQLFFEMENPNNVEIKLELKIDYMYGNEIELNISDDTEKLNFGIDYGSLMIASSHDIKNGYEELDGIIWMKDPIKLDKTKLYRKD